MSAVMETKTVVKTQNAETVLILQSYKRTS